MTDGRFEIVATLGPASFARVRELAAAGASGLRLNASHLSAAALGERARQAAEAAPELPVVVDLQGAKMRLGELAERHLEPGDRLRFELAPVTPGSVPVPHPELFAAAEPGARLGADDGRLSFRVLARGDDWLEAEALVAGVLRPRKGINRLDHPVQLSGITPGDAERLGAVAAIARLRVAWSFTLDGREADWVRATVPGVPVIGKVERSEAVERLDAIAARTDEIWICRGDLGEQLGLGRLARFVGRLDPRQLGCPVLMAGQVLEHLTAHPQPTRSEACHLYDLMARGYAGIVLSDETAIGSDPVGAVGHAARLVRSFEEARTAGGAVGARRRA